MYNQVARKAIMMASAVAMLAGCNKGTDSFSLLKDGADYKQQAVFIPKKIDILWVIDNSGSMETSQNNLASNFQSFINRFNQYNYDFHMAVTTTDAWEKQFHSDSVKARIRDGARLETSPGNYVTTSSGVFVMDKQTANLSNVFSTNIKQGTLGNGDERAFESFKQSLLEPFNVNFRRSEAFLAVIIVSDEEDFSGSSESAFEDASKNYTVQSYVDFLDGFTNVAANGKNYSVSVISVPDAACKTQLSTDGFQRKISTRLPQLADLTGGVKGSLCSNFGDTLELISDSIIQLSAVFKLNREPQVDTIKVTVDGVTVNNDATNGWTYNASDLTITFHGTSVPGANANIQIDYYPKSIKL
ncbi:MAG: hypothetical protein OM95_12555 [Bdellovibrio sp. ArHS]|uniref:hypothetical protein n=1 Tax=Bdellovibrio sp. ArHS TaxID=1569284 RepID=UPI00058334A2|nr:hypothetical protein [Bdellovibrio sp. ArHS]KHD87877.1 MAG: hypothetical protein OM95_12555 [Bdellovibrio sp. ArHS]